MHVLLIAPGHAIHTYRLVNALLDAGHRVTLLSRENRNKENRSGYEFMAYPGIRGFHRLNAGLAGLLEFPIRVRQMRGIVRSVQPDIVNVQGLDLRFAACAAAGVHPLVVTCWGADVNDLFDVNFDDQGYRSRMESLAPLSFNSKSVSHQALLQKLDGYKSRIGDSLKRASLVTGVTQQVLDRCEELAAERLPTKLFRFGVDRNVFKPGYHKEAEALRRQLGISQDAKVILSVRTLQPLFGHRDILDAFARVVRRAQRHHLVLVFQKKHTFEQELHSLESRARELGLEDKVFWLPERIEPDQLPVQYAMSDIVVNYPVHDGFPVSLLEAAASKCPVICSDIEAYGNVFDGAFLMVPPSDVESLASAIDQCLNEDEKHTRARVEQAFSVVSEIGDQQRNFLSFFAEMEDLIKQKHSRQNETRLTERVSTN